MIIITLHAITKEIVDKCDIACTDLWLHVFSDQIERSDVGKIAGQDDSWDMVG